MSRTITKQNNVSMKHHMHGTSCKTPIRRSHNLRKHSSVFLFALLLVLTYAPLVTLPFVEMTNVQSYSTPNLSVDGPFLNLTYYSNWNLTKTPLESGDRIEGDIIILNATFTPLDVVNKTRIEVNATALRTVISNEANETSVEIDTSRLNNNATCTVNVTAWLFNGSIFQYEITNIFLGNFYRPSITLLTPIEADVWVGVHNITWSASDDNLEDDLTFEVLFSPDGGKSFQLLTTGISETWYTWDTTGFLNLSTYVIEVRATDGIYTTWDRSGNFTAGTVGSTTTTTTTSTTSTETTTTETPPGIPDEMISVIIALIIVSSAFFALVAYFMAKSRI